MINVIVSDDEINHINEHYGTNASPESVAEYKLCQVILHLEEALRENGGTVRPIVDKSGD